MFSTTAAIRPMEDRNATPLLEDAASSRDGTCSVDAATPGGQVAPSRGVRVTPCRGLPNFPIDTQAILAQQRTAMRLLSPQGQQALHSRLGGGAAPVCSLVAPRPRRALGSRESLSPALPWFSDSSGELASDASEGLGSVRASLSLATAPAPCARSKAPPLPDIASEAAEREGSDSDDSAFYEVFGKGSADEAACEAEESASKGRSVRFAPLVQVDEIPSTWAPGGALAYYHWAVPCPSARPSESRAAVDPNPEALAPSLDPARVEAHWSYWYKGLTAVWAIATVLQHEATQQVQGVLPPWAVPAQWQGEVVQQAHLSMRGTNSVPQLTKLALRAVVAKRLRDRNADLQRRLIRWCKAVVDHGTAAWWGTCELYREDPLSLQVPTFVFSRIERLVSESQALSASAARLGITAKTMPATATTVALAQKALAVVTDELAYYPWRLKLIRPMLRLEPWCWEDLGARPELRGQKAPS